MDPLAAADPLTMVQRKHDSGGAQDAGDVRARAAEGVAGTGGPLPFFQTIQDSFGHHDVSGVRAHTDGAAADASRDIGAKAFAAGDDVAFAGTPDLHTAAHEAAHAVQQRGDVQLKGGVGADGDRYERHADRVADAVVAGRSAEALLDEFTGPNSAGSASAGAADGAPVQRKSLSQAGLSGGMTENAAVSLESKEGPSEGRRYDRTLDDQSDRVGALTAAAAESARVGKSYDGTSFLNGASAMNEALYTGKTPISRAFGSAKSELSRQARTKYGTLEKIGRRSDNEILRESAKDMDAKIMKLAGINHVWDWSKVFPSFKRQTKTIEIPAKKGKAKETKTLISYDPGSPDLAYVKSVVAPKITNNELNDVAGVALLDPFVYRVMIPYTKASKRMKLSLDYQHAFDWPGYITAVKDEVTGAAPATEIDAKMKVGGHQGAGDGVPGTYSNIHDSSDAGTVGDIAGVDPSGTLAANEIGIDAYTKLAGEGARWQCVRALGGSVRDESRFYTEKDGQIYYVAFKDLWLHWSDVFSKKYDIENSVVVAKLLNGGTRGTMNGQQVLKKDFNAGSSDYNLD